jgi:hypothetical protein
MRPRLIIAAAIVLVVALAVTRSLFWSPTAEANVVAVKSPSIDVSEMHANTKLPLEEKVHDMTFVFSHGD